MKKKQLLLLFFTLVYGLAFSQNTPTINATLSGKIVDKTTQEPLIGASVLIKGTTNGAITDVEGKFYLKTGQKLPFTLVSSFIGYTSQEIVVDKNTIIIELAPDARQLGEIVVVGYGTQEKKSLISSIAKINPKETQTTPVASFDAQLQGQAAGVQVNTFSGMPGEGVRVQVRGTGSINSSNDPLYVIDGVFANNNTLSTINLGSKFTSPLADFNPADIESIEILKDASAVAIYGSRGANGVVLITTKRGNYEAPKTKYDLNVSQGVQWADPTRMWELTTGPEHATLVNEAYTNSGIENPAQTRYSFATRPFQPNTKGIADPFSTTLRGNPEDQQTYDRLSKVFRTAQIKNYDFSVRGGGKSIRYYLGAGYTKQEAILRPASFERASFKFNFDTKLNENVTFGSSNGVYRSFRQQVRGGAGQEAGHLLSALHHPTYFPFTYADGTFSRGSIYESIDNLIDINTANISTTSLRYLGNQFVEVNVLPNLKFKTSFGLDYNIYNEQEFFNDQTQIGGVLNPGGYKNEVNTNFSVFVNEQTLAYKKTFGKNHNFSALIGNTIQATNLKVLSATGFGFPNNSFQQISAASNRTSAQSASKSTLASFFGRLTYNFDNRYFLEGTFRADASSKFGANNRWGYFPGIGAAWRVKQEAFLRNVDVISDLKLRVSAGTAGNQNGISDFAALGLWNGTAQYPDNLTSGDKSGTAPSQLANPDLKWEKTATYNVGVDLGLFKDRLFVDLNAYYKYTTDALLYVPIPGSTGYASVLSNGGEVSNKGVELAVTSTNIKRSGWEWSTTFNIARNVNRAEKLVSPITFEAREYIRTQEGAALGSYWLYKQLYVDSETGNAVFDDVDKDGKLTAADRQLLGNLIPDFFGGLTNRISYKGFDLNLLLTFQYGNKVYNFNRFILEGGGTRDASRSILKSQLNRWQKPGDVTDVPRLTFFGNNYTIEQNSRFLEDGSFLRVKSLSIGYSFPTRVARAIKAEKVRLFAQGTNLWIFTKYTGADPESSGSALQNRQGLDTATPPQPVGIQVGASISF
ncbi:SusC/RagA family TonB-linked outer membrane protein [Runella limosa]|uniref:SusC/RagA family TonB-linked outer membrane protein n=1 Tax=Runella limosa TaxID=370978 RepID=UPI00041697B6|nr:TonB-dependent receptor [Runella limosa]